MLNIKNIFTQAWFLKWNNQSSFFRAENDFSLVSLPDWRTNSGMNILGCLDLYIVQRIG